MVKKLNESSNTYLKRSLSMAITCLEDIVDDIFTLNARDYSKLIDALEVCKNIKSKLDAGKPISECASLNEADTFGVNVRPNQTKLDDLMDEGILSARDVADAAMGWMSDHDVGEMAEANMFFDIFDEEDEDLDESIGSNVLKIEDVAQILAGWAADTTDEDYDEDREDYIEKCYIDFIKELKDEKFVNSVIDLISTRIKNSGKPKFKSDEDDLADDKEVLNTIKRWKETNF